MKLTTMESNENPFPVIFVESLSMSSSQQDLSTNFHRALYAHLRFISNTPATEEMFIPSCPTAAPTLNSNLILFVMFQHLAKKMKMNVFYLKS